MSSQANDHAATDHNSSADNDPGTDDNDTTTRGSHVDRDPTTAPTDHHHQNRGTRPASDRGTSASTTAGRSGRTPTSDSLKKLRRQELNLRPPAGQRTGAYSGSAGHRSELVNGREVAAVTRSRSDPACRSRGGCGDGSPRTALDAAPGPPQAGWYRNRSLAMHRALYALSYAA